MEASEILQKVKEILEIDINVDWDMAELSPAEEFQAILNIITTLEQQNKLKYYGKKDT
jgi:hypothetical protein